MKKTILSLLATGLLTGCASILDKESYTDHEAEILKTSEGMRLETDGSGTFSLELSAPLGKGRMVGYAVSPNVIVSEVDFRCLH